MKFLELTRRYPFGYSVLFINPDKIETIFRVKDASNYEYTRIVLTVGNYYEVIETPNQILDQLEKLHNV